MGKIRIIAGQWRGRKLNVPEQEGLRPTADRVRETLFNWLTPVIEGSRCLDLFAGSGALGFEAASRGAAEVFCIERSASVCQTLKQHTQLLHTQQIQIICSDALQWLAKTPANPFDIIFLDPPFKQQLVLASCTHLVQYGWLKSPALIYVEMAKSDPAPIFPADWHIKKQQTAGQVIAYLLEWKAIP